MSEELSLLVYLYYDEKGNFVTSTDETELEELFDDRVEEAGMFRVMMSINVFVAKPEVPAFLCTVPAATGVLPRAVEVSLAAVRESGDA